jgi:hypothetical protein
MRPGVAGQVRGHGDLQKIGELQSKLDNASGMKAIQIAADLRKARRAAARAS